MPKSPLACAKNFAISFLLLWSISPQAFAQTSAQADSKTEPSSSNDKSKDSAASDDAESLANRVKALESELERISEFEEKAARADELEQRVESLEKRLDDAEMAEFEDLTEMSESPEPGLDVYGFFDISFIRDYLENSNTAQKNLVADHWSFTNTHLNIYFAGRLTSTLRTLVELRFTFHPNGMETFLPYQRVDTRVADRFSAEEFRLGGVAIERVQLTWQPREFFGVTLGRFLTPYGIWNIDHGSTVVIPMLLPYLQLRRAMPLAQTGAQVHGRFLLNPRLHLDYALTVSNGRGPVDELYDYDNNKALGLRLHLKYHGDDVYWALGGYGYYAKGTDVTKSIRFSIADDTLDANILSETTSKYDEWIGAADFLLTVHGVRVQLEWVSKRINYEIPPQLEIPLALTKVPGLFFQPSHIQWDAYLMLAWELPLERLLGGMSLTPFVMGEYSVQEDSQEPYSIYILRGGLNFAPNQFLVIKASAVRLHAASDETLIQDAQWTFGAQVAVTF